MTIDLTVSNAGPNAATDVVVQGSLAEGLTYAGSQGPGTFDPLSQVWTVGTVGAGQTQTLVITGQVNSSDAETATASISGTDQYDPVAGNNSASVSFTPQQAGVTLSTSVDDPTPNVGDTVTFTVEVSNEGPDAATGLTVLGLLPAGLAFQSATASQGGYSSSNGDWVVGGLDSDGTAALTITATVVSPDASSFNASVADLDQYDPDSDLETGSVIITPQQSDLSVIGNIGDATYNVGNNVPVTFEVDNSGASDATNVALAITIPAGLTLEGTDYDSGSYDSTTGLWTIGTLPSGDSLKITLDLTVVSSSASSVVATVQDDQYDPTAADRTSTMTLTPQQADLSVSASVSDPTPISGEEVEFTITLADVGPDDATSAVVSVPLPSGYEYVDDSESAGTYNSETGEWDVGEVDLGTPANLTLYAEVTSVDPGPVAASIVSADQYDPTTANNTASATVRPQEVDLAIGKVVSNPTPNVGDTITYTISLINSGPDTATGVTVGDTLPSGITYVSSTGDEGLRLRDRRVDRRLPGPRRGGRPGPDRNGHQPRRDGEPGGDHRGRPVQHRLGEQFCADLGPAAAGRAAADEPGQQHDPTGRRHDHRHVHAQGPGLRRYRLGRGRGRAAGGPVAGERHSEPGDVRLHHGAVDGRHRRRRGDGDTDDTGHGHLVRSLHDLGRHRFGRTIRPGHQRQQHAGRGAAPDRGSRPVVLDRQRDPERRRRDHAHGDAGGYRPR